MTGVDYQVRDAIAEIVLDNPPANAITEPMVDGILGALARAAADARVRAVILASAVPQRFCAGLDLHLLEGASPERMRGLVEKLYTGITEAQFRLGKPSIAAVSGAARGGGMTLAISCDLIVAGHAATFGYPEIDVGLLPAIHFTHLHRIVGRHRAFDLLFTGRSFDVREAASLGLVNRVVEDTEVRSSARALAQQLAAKSPTAMRIGRAAFLSAFDAGYRQGVSGAVETFSSVAVSDDGREGVAAFRARRKPGWKV